MSVPWQQLHYLQRLIYIRKDKKKKKKKRYTAIKSTLPYYEKWFMPWPELELQASFITVILPANIDIWERKKNT